MSDYWLEKINENESLKRFIEDSMKEAAWQAWKCFAFRDKVWFEKWWYENPPTMNRPDGFEKAI